MTPLGGGQLILAQTRIQFESLTYFADVFVSKEEKLP